MNFAEAASNAGSHIVGTPYPEGTPTSFVRRAFHQITLWGLRLLICLTLWAVVRAFYLGDRNTAWQALVALVILVALLFGTFSRSLHIVGGWPVLAVALPALWLRWGGSYHHRLDYVLLFAVTLGAAWFFDRNFFEWLRKAVRYFLPFVAAGRPELKPPRHALREKRGLLFCLTSLFFFWLVASTVDRAVVWSGVQAQPRAAGRFAELRAKSPYPGVKVGVALSGGGYRAALVHSGVLNALDATGVPVTHITSVSGGSIIGAFYAAGGEPHLFRDAVADNRFNLAREVTNFWNAARLVSPARVPGTATTLLPTSEFERTDVQASLLDSILLDGVKLDHLEQDGMPRLMLCATDLYSGATVGISKGGVLRRFIINPAEKDAYLNFLPPPQSERYVYVPREAGQGFPYDARVSQLVAASGAFPGAFNGVAAQMVIERGKEARHVMLADGGLSDNSALTAMNFAPYADDGWAVDLSISSDASALFNERQSIPALGELSRAIDIVYANVGVRRDADACVTQKPQLLLTPGRYFDRRGERNDEAIDKAVGEAVENADEATLGLLLKIVGTRPPADEESRRLLARRAADQLKLGLDTFMSTPTLKDHFEGETANQLFRLGQLLVAVEWPAIKKELDEARAGWERRQHEQRQLQKQSRSQRQQSQPQHGQAKAAPARRQAKAAARRRAPRFGPPRAA